MNNIIEGVKQHFETLGFYKKVVYADHNNGTVYFHAIDLNNSEVLLKADIQDNTNFDEWDLWESYDEYDWTFVS